MKMYIYYKKVSGYNKSNLSHLNLIQSQKKSNYNMMMTHIRK